MRSADFCNVAKLNGVTIATLESWETSCFALSVEPVSWVMAMRISSESEMVSIAHAPNFFATAVTPTPTAVSTFPMPSAMPARPERAPLAAVVSALMLKFPLMPDMASLTAFSTSECVMEAYIET